MSRISLFPRRSRLSRAVCGALAVLALGAAASTWAAGTGDAPASAVASGNPAPLTVTVQPGQSLNDIAIAATQSRDPAVLARAGRALFDANPQAFMKRDPSRLKVGATLTVPALDASGAAIAAGASAPATASAASSAAAASGAASAAQHAASAAHGASAAAAAAPIQHPAASGTAHGASAPAGASFVAPSSDAAVAHGASAADTASAAVAAAGASGPHMWSGTIQPAPSSASDATAQSSQTVQPTSGARAPAGAAPAAAASQPRPSSLQQLLALKNRVLMELQKHGIGKPAATTAPVVPAPTAPVTPRAPDDAGASSAAAASSADAASGTAASAASAAAPSVQASAPVVATPPANRGEPIDWRPAALAGAAVVVLAGGLVWRKRRKHRHAEAVAAGATDDASPSAEQALPIEPETPVSRDVVSDVNFAAIASAAAEAVAPTNEVASTPEAAKPEESNREAAKPEPTNLEAANPEASNREAANREPTNSEATNREAAEPQAPNREAANPQPTTPFDDRPQPSSSVEPVHPTDGAPLPHDAKPAFDAEPSAPLASSVPVADAAAPSTTDPQHAALMQNAITALGSLDMPLPPRAAGETPSSSDDAEATHIATNGQTAPHPPVGANNTSTEHPADHEDELEWDDDAPHADTSARPAAPSPLSPLGGAQFGALNLDFDLDLPSAPGAELPALTPEELARIARNKLDLAAEYVELGDLSGARALLQEVVDANDAATRDDARAMLAKLSEDA
ncbi:FimV/HubP family polar landmark protein [Burkholderia multivorans]|uniref:FimV/HubP family polar landmark protein n=1 Tax=Burkholderia multivorans TaxID=87883 RepID=UPI0007529184|nr:FimV/HubP family polar landmark protein [Burkholderia multivorans]KVS08768.1 pilus assembly protein FimV [Burkholderia multivorans]MBU9248144.1 pilus assembly protein FimV [Burkholderia multivorans]MBU9254179.1 pilus assembly protein FimV [Burkholderia multivorans]MDN7755758.1 FimV/HubP family polar landmark protein [Burkholderia multivorans]MDN8102204.1 FimV/HubP family polar landmark protein [Burkholderia multivorans]